MRLEPPKPKRLVKPVSSMKHGMAMVAAATCSGSLSLPMKNVSAMLQTTVMSWLITAGIASVSTAFRTGASEKSAVRSVFMVLRLLVKTVDDAPDGKAVAFFQIYRIMREITGSLLRYKAVHHAAQNPLPVHPALIGDRIAL